MSANVQISASRPGPGHAGGPERSSDLLLQTAAAVEGGRITIAEMIDAFGRRGLGVLLILLGAPNILPLPVPGLSILSGLPLLALSSQIVLGRDEPWLPQVLARRSMATEDFRRITARLVPYLQRLERIVRPRLPGVTEGAGRRLLGLLAVLLAAALCLPLPFGNGLPGLAISLIGLALLERDGLVALAGVAVAAVGLAVTTAATGAIVGAALFGLGGL